MRGKLTDKEMKERIDRRIARKKATTLPISTTRVPIRKEMRSFAKYEMGLAKGTKLCKKNSKGKSFFSANWRNWCFKKLYKSKKRSA